MVEDSAKKNRADSKKGIPNGNIAPLCFNNDPRDKAL
jgi:hypothetical protein